MIKATPKGYVVYNENGSKKLSKPYPTRKDAQDRLKQIEVFKRNKK